MGIANEGLTSGGGGGGGGTISGREVRYDGIISLNTDFPAEPIKVGAQYEILQDVTDDISPGSNQSFKAGDVIQWSGRVVGNSPWITTSERVTYDDGSEVKTLIPRDINVQDKDLKGVKSVLFSTIADIYYSVNDLITIVRVSTGKLIHKLGDDVGNSSSVITNNNDVIVHEVDSTGQTTAGKVDANGSIIIKKTNGDTGVELRASGTSRFLGGALTIGSLIAKGWFTIIGSTLARPQMNLEDGVIPTTPNAGDLYRFGDKLYYLPSLTRIINLANQPTKVIYINAIEDFPIQDATTITCETGFCYWISGNHTTAKYFIIPDGADVRFTASTVLSGIEYTGSGAMFRASNSVDKLFAGFLTFTTVYIKGDDSVGQSLFALYGTSGGSVFINSCPFSNFESLGEVKGIDITHLMGAYNDISYGYVLKDNELIAILDVEFENWNNAIGSVFMSISGTVGSVQIARNPSNMQSNEKFIYIDPTTVENEGALVANNSFNYQDRVLATGSKDQTDPNWKWTGNTNFPDSKAIGYANALNQGGIATVTPQDRIVPINASYTSIVTEKMSVDPDGIFTYFGKERISLAAMPTISGTVSTGTKIGYSFYIAKGNSTNSIVSFADLGGGQVRVTTSADHGYSNGDEIQIMRTTSYDGGYSTPNASGNIFDITATFVATETGKHFKAILSSKIKNDFTAGSDSNTGVSISIPDISENDQGVLCSQRNSVNAANWETSDIHFNNFLI